MAKKKGSDINEENDFLTREGHKELYKENKTKTIKRNLLKDEETKKATMDFIFSGKDSDSKSPLES